MHLKVEGIPKEASSEDVAVLKNRISRFCNKYLEEVATSQQFKLKIVGRYGHSYPVDKDAKISIEGLPYVLSPSAKECFHNKLEEAVREFIADTGIKQVMLIISNGSDSSPAKKASVNDTELDGEISIEKRAERYQAQPSIFDSGNLVIKPHLPAKVKEEIGIAVDTIRFEWEVFDEWGLSAIEPNPSSLINFKGKPGTGKTLCAHWLAHTLKIPILAVRYPDIVSKFHGESTKNVQAIFYAAKRDGALLFVDEADDLLQKRSTDISQGTDREANAVCNQFIVEMQNFNGIFVAASNLVEVFDPAINDRVVPIEIPMPNEEARREIWRTHLSIDKLPLANDVSIDELAKVDSVSGRTIKKAVIQATVKAKRQGKTLVEMADFVDAIQRLKAKEELPANSSSSQMPHATSNGKVETVELDAVNNLKTL